MEITEECILEREKRIGCDEVRDDVERGLTKVACPYDFKNKPRCAAGLVASSRPLRPDDLGSVTARSTGFNQVSFVQHDVIHCKDFSNFFTFYDFNLNQILFWSFGG